MARGYSRDPGSVRGVVPICASTANRRRSNLRETAIHEQFDPRHVAAVL